jgi:hypothetical protein
MIEIAGASSRASMIGESVAPLAMVKVLSIAAILNDTPYVANFGDRNDVHIAVSSACRAASCLKRAAEQTRC